MHKLNSSNILQKKYASLTKAADGVFGSNNCIFCIDKINKILYKVSTSTYSTVRNYAFSG